MKYCLGCGSRVLILVTETVASYSLLRKTVDQFSHGSAGWQGLVTERTALQPKPRPCLSGDCQMGVGALFLAGVCMPVLGGRHHPGKQKGKSDSLSLPSPTRHHHQSPRGYVRFEFFKKLFLVCFFPGTDKCFKPCPYPPRPQRSHPLVFSVDSVLCVWSCFGSSF